MATDVAPAVSSIDNRNLLMSILHINGSVVIRPQSTETATLNAEPMTDRESQVLSLVAEGFSNKLIGGELGICERTVKNHLTSIMTKL
ncbi:MAG: helix-turn-helix transcriptional regulator, partial [SAR202 cluster bacterium]|nr:helix-turn-helix transcriptional regulator [SAR202 cluster bacterium]